MSDPREWAPPGLGRRARRTRDSRRAHQERMVAYTFVPGEYETVLRALESVATNPDILGQRHQQEAYHAWTRMLVEGGHINPEQFEILEAAYGPRRLG